MKFFYNVPFTRFHSHFLISYFNYIIRVSFYFQIMIVRNDKVSSSFIQYDYRLRIFYFDRPISVSRCPRI